MRFVFVYFFKSIIPEWLDFAEKNNLIIRFFGLPICVLGDNYIYSNDLTYDARMTYELGVANDEIILKPKKNDISRRRQKLPQCQQCNFKDLCGGIFTKYFEIKGDKEIKPL